MSSILIPPFRIDPQNERLWRDGNPVPLTPKAFRVLMYLAERPGRLVTKDELLEAVWTDTHVLEGVLKSVIRELRKALEDSAEAPRYIETQHRRGYRFIAPIQSSAPSWESAEPGTPEAPSLMVGRDGALHELERFFRLALEGRRQVVFVTGDPGIGKTTLLEAFLAGVRTSPHGRDVWLTTGQCLEQHAGGEPYLPVLDAFGRLCREPARQFVLDVLRQHAPAWLAQMPSLVAPADREALQREVFGATRERMLREMTEALEVMAARFPIILVIEDLHWCDYSTLDLLVALARRQPPARLMVIGTYRPADVIQGQHPLRAAKQDLQLRQLCGAILLGLLSESDVQEYLDRRFGERRLEGLGALLHAKTDGSPLFLVNLVDELVSQGVIARRGERWELATPLDSLRLCVPASLRQAIERQVERLSADEQRLLEAAAVMGEDFNAVTLAGALECAASQPEDRLEELERQHMFVRPVGTVRFADGTASSRFRFLHSLYRDVLYERIPEARRVRFHLSIARRMEELYGEHVLEVAAELANHYGRAGEFREAIRCLCLAADAAGRRYASREALEHLTHAVRLAAGLPYAEADERRMDLLMARGHLRRAIGDMQASLADLGEAAAIARRRGRVDIEIRSLLESSQAWFHLDRRQSLEIMDQAISKSAGVPDENLRLWASACSAELHMILGRWSSSEADLLELAATSEQWDDPAIRTRLCWFYSFLLTYRGEYDRAGLKAEEAIRCAVEIRAPYEFYAAKYAHFWALLHAGRLEAAERSVREAVQVAEKNEFRLASTLFPLALAWIRMERGEATFAAGEARRTLAAMESAPAGGQIAYSLASVLENFALLRLGEVDNALEGFRKLAELADHGQILLERIYVWLLRQGLAQCELARKNYTEARRHAESLLEFAAESGNRTYQARARRVLAEIALAENRLEDAEREDAEAVALVRSHEALTTEAEVNATAARVGERRSKQSDEKAAPVRTPSHQ